MGKDYYKTLDVPRSASDDEIKRAYKKMVHPYPLFYYPISHLLGPEMAPRQKSWIGRGFKKVQRGGPLHPWKIEIAHLSPRFPKRSRCSATRTSVPCMTKLVKRASRAEAYPPEPAHLALVASLAALPSPSPLVRVLLGVSLHPILSGYSSAYPSTTIPNTS